MVLILAKLKMHNEIDCLNQGSPYCVNPKSKLVLLKLVCFTLLGQGAGFCYFILFILAPPGKDLLAFLGSFSKKKVAKCHDGKEFQPCVFCV